MNSPSDADASAAAHVDAASQPTQPDRRLILLGPQPDYATLREALRRARVTQPVALITAGWEEDELEPRQLQPLMAALPEGSFNLELFRRSEELFKADPPLIQALRDRQDQLRLLRDVYRDRLEHAIDAYHLTDKRRDDRLDFAPERESAIENVRQLDRQYFLRTSQICDAWESRLNTPARAEVQRHVREIGELLDGASAIVIGGGHAAIILNRLRIFGILETDHHLPVIAWSGGAMALGEQIVLFHDSPPEGRRGAEVLRAGIGLYSEYLPLPHARERMMLDDAKRVKLFARRFQPGRCLVFDEGTLLDRYRGQWWMSEGTQQLTDEGLVKGVVA